MFVLPFILPLYTHCVASSNSSRKWKTRFCTRYHNLFLQNKWRLCARLDREEVSADLQRHYGASSRFSHLCRSSLQRHLFPCNQPLLKPEMKQKCIIYLYLKKLIQISYSSSHITTLQNVRYLERITKLFCTHRTWFPERYWTQPCNQNRMTSEIIHTSWGDKLLKNK